MGRNHKPEARQAAEDSLSDTLSLPCTFVFYIHAGDTPLVHRREVNADTNQHQATLDTLNPGDEKKVNKEMH
jgi:hypothetical protein